MNKSINRSAHNQIINELESICLRYDYRLYINLAQYKRSILIFRNFKFILLGANATDNNIMEFIEKEFGIKLTV